MRVHIYRPPILSYSLRKFKYYDENNKLLSYASNDTEVILSDAPSSIKVKVDWLSGKVENLEGDEIYLICYSDQNMFWEVFLPSQVNRYFRFMQLSKEEYEKAIATKGQFLGVFPSVSKTKAIASRILSLLLLAIVAILFYLTDYSSSAIPSDDKEFIRVLGLIMGLGAVTGLIWNKERYFNLYIRAILIIIMAAFFGWVLSPQGFDINLFLYPILCIIFLLGIYVIVERNITR